MQSGFQRLGSDEIFVGREAELEIFQQIIQPASEVHLLNIHSDGDFGIGKTKLVLKMQKVCEEEYAHQIVCNNELIDFYHTEYRSELSLLRQLASNFGDADFVDFRSLVKKYDTTQDTSERQAIDRKLEPTFFEDYTKLSEKLQDRIIVLFFDSYEYIQIEHDLKQVEATPFSTWLETELFPHFLQHKNTRVIVSGRYPLLELKCPQESVKSLPLQHLNLEKAIEFWKKAFHVNTKKEIADKIEEGLAEEKIDIIYEYTRGRPIILALFADLIKYSNKENSLVKQLLEQIRESTDDSTPHEKQKVLFEKSLVNDIVQLVREEDRVLPYMAIAYHRMTPDLLCHLTPDSLDFEKCLQIIKQLKLFSFIKPKTDNIILLHDEMRNLIRQHFWDDKDEGGRERDPDWSQRKEIAKNLVEYYTSELLTENISNESWKIYMAECIEYALLADPKKGIELFCSEFDIALEDGRYDACDFFLRVAEIYDREYSRERKHLSAVPFPDFLEIQRRRVKYTTDIKGEYNKSLEIINSVLMQRYDFSTREASVLQGHFLFEQGSAKFGQGEFQDALDCFKRANVVFYNTAEDLWLHRVDNWRGYIHSRQGKFKDAEKYLLRSRKGSYTLLLKQEQGRKKRKLLQGYQLSLGNLAGVYNYAGQSERAIRKAEIVLNIVRSLPRNNLEIARSRITLAHAFALAGRSIDARHHLKEAETLLQHFDNRLLTGRLNLDSGILAYHVEELSRILEYYRAGDIENIIQAYRENINIKEAEKFLQQAVKILSSPSPIKKELADAWYALGELYMITGTEDHWQKSEEAFQKSLEFGQESQFQYIVADTLESLVTLYYFWNGASAISDKLKRQNQNKLLDYQGQLEVLPEFKNNLYPDIFAKYDITCGDINFDEALRILREQAFDAAEPVLYTAFEYYLKAAVLMENFSEDRHYLALRVFYNRLNTFIDDQLTRSDSSQILERVEKLQQTIQGSSPKTEKRRQKLYKYIILRLQPENIREGISDLQDHIQKVLDKGNLGWALLLNDCLIEAYKNVLQSNQGNEVDQETLVLRLNAQVDFYRMVGDEYHAKLYIQIAREQLQKVNDFNLKNALEGCVDTSEATLLYRRGEYGQLIEFYLQDELEIARDKFDTQYGGERKEAYKLFSTGIEKLLRAITYWETQISEQDTEQLKQRLRTYRQRIAEAKFRLGELLILDESFSKESGQRQAFSCFLEAMDYSQRSDYLYRYDDALQSYVNALYFSGKYDHPDYQNEREQYEKLLDGKSHFVTIMGKLRIVQGDALFSRCFKREAIPSAESGWDYHYKVTGEIPDVLVLRTMLRYYVEACNFMAQHSPVNFTSAARVLQRRIELISDKPSLKTIAKGLKGIWEEQDALVDKKEDDLEALLQFAEIRGVLLEK